MLTQDDLEIMKIHNTGAWIISSNQQNINYVCKTSY